MIDSALKTACVRGFWTPTILLPRLLLETLTPAELRNLLAHELAHVVYRSNFWSLLMYLWRLLSFFNPISLVIFRRLIHEMEHACDDWAVEATGDSSVFASVLERMDPESDIFLRERRERLLEPRGPKLSSPRSSGLAVLLTMCIVVISYFLV